MNPKRSHYNETYIYIRSFSEESLNKLRLPRTLPCMQPTKQYHILPCIFLWARFDRLRRKQYMQVFRWQGASVFRSLWLVSLLLIILVSMLVVLEDQYICFRFNVSFDLYDFVVSVAAAFSVAASIPVLFFTNLAYAHTLINSQVQVQFEIKIQLITKLKSLAPTRKSGKKTFGEQSSPSFNQLCLVDQQIERLSTVNSPNSSGAQSSDTANYHSKPASLACR